MSSLNIVELPALGSIRSVSHCVQGKVGCADTGAVQLRFLQQAFAAASKKQEGIQAKRR